MAHDRLMMVGAWALVTWGCAAAAVPDASTPGEAEHGEDEAVAISEPPEDSAQGEGEAAKPTQVPQFSPGMTVAEAQDAVPSSIERLNIEQEALAAPLMEPELYAPCALEGHHHFKLKVAVYDGQAVGLDLETSPSDEKLEGCLRQQITSVEWKDRAKSINTVEYSY